MCFSSARMESLALSPYFWSKASFLEGFVFSNFSPLSENLGVPFFFTPLLGYLRSFRVNLKIATKLKCHEGGDS